MDTGHIYIFIFKEYLSIFESEYPYFSPKLQILQHMHYNWGSGNLWTSFFALKMLIFFKQLCLFETNCNYEKKLTGLTKMIYIVWDFNNVFIDKFYSNHDSWNNSEVITRCLGFHQFDWNDCKQISVSVIQIKELSLCHKLWFSKNYIFATQWRRL